VAASTLRDTLGVNVDLWRNQYAWSDFPAVLRKIRKLRLGHARVLLQAKARGGIPRLKELGRAGVQLDLEMGDALGRYDTAPFSALATRLRKLAPSVESVEGTNELDLTGPADWATVAKNYQRQVQASVPDPAQRRIGVVAPSVGRLANYAPAGSYAGLADASNAHAYADGDPPEAALAQWTRQAAQSELPGAPQIVTEAGYQTDLSVTRGSLPVPELVAGEYLPRLILEAIRRGVPRVYLYELVDRWPDPFNVDVAAHFGLLGADLREKPGFKSLVRLQNALAGAAGGPAAPLRASIVSAPPDLRLLAFRQRSGRAVLALWRPVSLWNAQTQTAVAAPPQAVTIKLAEPLRGASALALGAGKRTPLRGGRTLKLAVGGDAILVEGIGRVR